jgi:hypothetical protein
VFDEHPVGPVSRREGEHPALRATVGHDKGVDLAGRDGAQGVLCLGHPDQRIRLGGPLDVQFICHTRGLQQLAHPFGADDGWIVPRVRSSR